MHKLLKSNYAILIIIAISLSFSVNSQSKPITNFVQGQLFVQVSSEHIDLTINGPAELKTHPYLKDIPKSIGIQKITHAFKLKNEALQRIYLVEFTNASKTNDLIKFFSNKDFVAFAEKVPAYEFFYTPDDPLLSNQWHLQTVQAELAWDEITTQTSNVVIAIVDDAVLLSHEDLAPNIWTNTGEIPGDNIDNDGNGYIDDVNGWDAADNDNNANPDNPTDNFFTHGTHCAGIASARTDNATGIASLGYHAQIMPVKCAQLPNPMAVVAGYLGVEYAIASGADVISMSWGGGFYSATYQLLFDEANAQGIVCVAAAGNSNTNVPMYPASYNHVISVGATDQNDSKAVFSNFGTSVDVMAPGVAILSSLAGSNSSYGNLQGTSMACPLVSGLAAMLIAADPNLTPEEIENCITSTADDISAQNPGFDGFLGSGRINAFNAIACVQQVIARFESNYTLTCPGTQVEFYDISSGSPTSWQWNFEGGSPATSTDQNPIITYNTPGVYEVSLTVSDGTNSDDIVITNYITVEAPSATLSGNATIYPGYNAFLEFNFTGNAPWSVTYTDGSTNITLNNITQTPYLVQVNPTATTSYSIVDFNDDQCNGTYLGECLIEVLPENPFHCYYSKYYGDAGINTFSDIYYEPSEDAIYAAGKNGANNGLFAKIAPNGDLDFAVELSNFPSGFSGITTAPNGDKLCVANVNEDVVVARFTNTGTLLWTKSYSLIRERRPLIIPSTGDSYIIALWYSTGSTSDDAALFRIDANGEVLWTSAWHNIDDEIFDVIPNGSGGAYFAGGMHVGSVDMFIGEIDVNGNFIKVDEFNSSGFVMNETFQFTRALNGDFITLNRMNATNTSPSDANLMRLDADFNKLWEVNFTFPNGRINYMDAVIEDAYGYIYASCRYNDATQEQAAILKFDADGNLLWTKQLADTRALNLISTRSNSPDNIIASRVYDDLGFGSQDAFIARMDTSLNSCIAVPTTTSFLSGVTTKTPLSYSLVNINYTAQDYATVWSALNYQTGSICEDCNIEAACDGVITPLFDVTPIVCLGDLTQFTDQSTSSSGSIVSWEWDFGDGTPESNVQNPTHSYAQTGFYSVTLMVTNDGVPACTEQRTITVQVVDHPVITQPSDTLICIGQNVDHNLAMYCGTESDYTYNWSPGIYTTDSTILSPEFTPLTTTEYTLNAISANDTIVITFTINVDEDCCITDADFEAPQHVCVGDTIQLTNTSTADGQATYTWDFGDLTNPSQFEGEIPPFIIPGTGGYYPISLTIEDECRIDSITYYVGVSNLPLANAGGDQQICGPSEVPLGDATTSGYSYSWSPVTGLDDPTVSDPTASVTDSSTYVVTVVDSWTGCVNTDTVTITLECECTFEMPNVFTPGADGANDTYHPIMDGDCSELKLTILNRWGLVVWDSESAGNLYWNGTTQNGSLAPDGVYYYLVEFEGTEQHGFISLIREP